MLTWQMMIQAEMKDSNDYRDALSGAAVQMGLADFLLVPGTR